jgi:hypothetical protein
VGIEGPKIMPRSSLSNQLISHQVHAASIDAPLSLSGGGVGADEAEGEAEEQEVTWVYSSTGDKQLWELPGLDSRESRGDDGTEDARSSSDEGGSLWLPGGVIVTFRMISMEPDDGINDDDGVETTEKKGSNMKHSLLTEIEAGGSNRVEAAGAARGLCFGMTWIQEEGQCLQIERFYDDQGVLREVRQMTGVKVRYKGGSM